MKREYADAESPDMTLYSTLVRGGKVQTTRTVSDRMLRVEEVRINVQTTKAWRRRAFSKLRHKTRKPRSLQRNVIGARPIKHALELNHSAQY